MRQRAASHSVGLLSEANTRAVEDRADARHCGVSSMRAQAKNQIAQFLPNPGRRILGARVPKRWQHLFAYSVPFGRR